MKAALASLVLDLLGAVTLSVRNALLVTSVVGPLVVWAGLFKHFVIGG